MESMSRNRLSIVTCRFFIAILTLSAMTACSHGGKPPSQPNLDNEMNQTYHAAKHYTADQKKALQVYFQKKIDKLDRRIDSLNAESLKLDKLKNKISITTDSADVMIKLRIKDLKRKEKDLRAQLVKLRQSSGTAWDILEEHVRKSYQVLKEGVNKAAREISH